MTPNALMLPAFIHLIYFGAVLPYRTWNHRNVWPAPEARRPKVERYWANVRMMAFHGVMSCVALFALPPVVRHALFPSAWPSLTGLLLGVGTGAIVIGIDLVYSRRCFERDAPHMYQATPRTREEQVAWTAQSFAAGITEELTWRGVQPALIAQLTGQSWLAVLMCIATFGLGHVRQGKPFVPIAALFALLFQLLTWWTGGLYVPMIAHAAVNVVVGLRAGQWLTAKVTVTPTVENRAGTARAAHDGA